MTGRSHRFSANDNQADIDNRQEKNYSEYHPARFMVPWFCFHMIPLDAVQWGVQTKFHCLYHPSQLHSARQIGIHQVGNMNKATFC